MEIKDLLLKNVSENKFFDICNFIEEVYLMEYDILILMARKFFNLFCVFHEINCEKYERLKIPYENKGKIITNRALPLIRYDVQNCKMKKIIVADDIIIHGRSIREVYDELERLCPYLDILLMSYVRNDHDKTTYEDIIERIQSRYLVEVHEWRELSDEIVNMFYMSGRPYISYLPYFSLNIEWKDLKDKLIGEEWLSIANEDMQRYEVSAYIYTGDKLKIFNELNCCQICAIRIYHYSLIDKTVVVPYFCMNVLEEKQLEELSDFFRDNFLELEYLSLVEENDGANEMRIMELEYALSAWMGMYFLDVLKLPISIWHKDIEDYNFCGRVISDAILAENEIKRMIEKVKRVSQQAFKAKPKWDNKSTILQGKYRELKEVYIKNFGRWNEMRKWHGNNEDYGQRFIDNYLAINGNIDEERCKNNDIEKKRLFGMPIAYILEDMVEFLYELFGCEKSKEYYIRQVFAALIVSVDSGRGTIVTKIGGKPSESRCNESVIYAGEQNYKFYANTNFPIMYGLYLIEQELKQNNASDKIISCKREMVEKFVQYLEKEKIFYIKEELLQIANLDLKNCYKKFLQNAFEKYYQNAVLDKAITMALGICSKIIK